MKDEILVYPGCVIPSKLPYLEAAALFILEKVGLQTSNFPEFSCCFEPVGLRSLGPDTWLAACARLHSVASGRPILTLCDGCNLSLYESAQLLESPKEMQKAQNLLRELNRELKQTSEVIGLLELLHSHLESIKNHLTQPQSLRLLVHPGCHCEHVCSEKGLSGVQMLADIVMALGGEPIIFEEGLCCGGGLTSVNDVLSKKIMRDALDKMSEKKADAIVTSCPFCFTQFDLIGRTIPVIHLAELVARALGWTVDTAPYHRT